MGRRSRPTRRLYANRTHTSIEEEVRRWLKEARATDEEEDRLYGPDRRGDELPPELADRRSRLARLKECKEQLEREAAQAVVREDQIVVAAEVTREENDVHQLHPMLSKAKENLGVAGFQEEIKAVVADAGYWSEANIREADPRDLSC